MNKTISIIIPTKNEQANIRRCLSSIISNGYPDIEIIVVDQGSTDQTVAIAKKLGAKIIKVPASSKYVPPSQSRNTGFQHSTGSTIYHLDADMELETGLLSEIYELLKDPSTAAVVIPETDIPGNFWAKGKAFERSLYKKTSMEAARATTREIFSNIKYTAGITSGEDWFIHSRYQDFGQVKRTDKSVYHHLGSLSLLKEFKKKLFYGSSSVNYLKSNFVETFNRFIILSWIYFKGFFTHILVSPLSLFAFIIVRITDLVALSLGLIFYRHHA